jgi:hypothetical protein
MGPESGPEGARKQGYSQKNSRRVIHFRVRVDGARFVADVRFKNDPPYGSRVSYVLCSRCRQGSRAQHHIAASV